MHLSLYNSRIQDPLLIQTKGVESHNQIRAVALGLPWDLVIPANSPSDHMGVVDPLV